MVRRTKMKIELELSVTHINFKLTKEQANLLINVIDQYDTDDDYEIELFDDMVDTYKRLMSKV